MNVQFKGEGKTLKRMSLTNLPFSVSSSLRLTGFTGAATAIVASAARACAIFWSAILDCSFER
jgi:hypothetical protein